MARRGRGEGTVYRRADGRWEAAFGIDGRRQRYVGRSQREVRVKLLAARRALEQGIVLSGSSQQVEEYLTRWLEDSVRPSVRWTTHRAYSLCMRRLFPLTGTPRRFRPGCSTPGARRPTEPGGGSGARPSPPPTSLTRYSTPWGRSTRCPCRSRTVGTRGNRQEHVSSRHGPRPLRLDVKLASLYALVSAALPWGRGDLDPQGTAGRRLRRRLCQVVDGRRDRGTNEGTPRKRDLDRIAARDCRADLCVREDLLVGSGAVRE